MQLFQFQKCRYTLKEVQQFQFRKTLEFHIYLQNREQQYFLLHI